MNERLMYVDWLMERIAPLNRKALKGTLTESEQFELFTLNEIRLITPQG